MKEKLRLFKYQIKNLNCQLKKSYKLYTIVHFFLLVMFSSKCRKLKKISRYLFIKIYDANIMNWYVTKPPGT